jgi:UDP-galactopyranose mutase
VTKTLKRAVLVTGGAGYIGSHTAKALFDQGYTPVVFDNLSTGHREAVRWGPFVHGDIRDAAAVREAMREHDVGSIIHFAGRIEVGRSMARPDQFFDINVNGLAQVLAAARECGVARIVFSSSAAVYGDSGLPTDAALTEDLPKTPTSCYGETKLIGEWMLADHCRAFGLSAVALRYFNASGADPSGLIGEAHHPETHLIPLAIQAALGVGPPLTVFGDDFDTPDGSCLRDYIHVCDLAAAHVAALEAPMAPGTFEAVNVGAGAGASVLDVIKAVAEVVGRPVPHAIGPRRAGDPPSLVADPARARALLGWSAKRSDLVRIVKDAVEWSRYPKFGPAILAAHLHDREPRAVAVLHPVNEGLPVSIERSDRATRAQSFSPKGAEPAGGQTVVCFSHLRWNFVFQRPQHLMSRFARDRQVIYWEEPLSAQDTAAPMLETRICPQTGVMIATPRLPDSLTGAARDQALKGLLETLVGGQGGDLIRWYYTPMMLSFSRRLDAACTVYDCMDELANFKFAPPELAALEQELLSVADVVFTGGHSLYEAKQHRHHNIHPFPSSVDHDHFAAARTGADVQPDQKGLPRPRLGFYGVVDERMDLELLAAVADARPDWSLVIVGPVVKIDPAALPQRANLHYLGGKTYDELPAYLAGWDVALMPFAINESTRFISPTKTPEYLAGGRPVVSTPIVDVVRHYGELEGVKIAGSAEAFIAACDEALALVQGGGAWRDEADAALSALSWDETFARMAGLVTSAVDNHVDSALAAAGLERANDPASPAIRTGVASKAYDYLVVGAGFAGSVLAERLASQLGKRVLVVDRRPHIAGNAYDEHDAAGVLMHRYGPHIFHTNAPDIAAYLSQFTQWRPYEHRVLGAVAGQLTPIPINRTTLNMLYGAGLTTDAEAQAFLEGRAETLGVIRTSEDVVVSKVGRELYELFFRGYTRKQWGLDPSELDKSVTSRVPTRTNTDDRYFTDSFQAMPLHGYTAMFAKMLDHPNITVRTGVEFEDVRREAAYDQLIYTGPIDEFFDHRFGKLPYRSLTFRHETLEQPWFQAVGTVNYPDEATAYTRISEYKHITGQESPRTTITYEYPSAEGDPYYPIPRPENQALFKRYEALALQQQDVHFVGRLATYKYYNMDQVVAQALAAFRRIAKTAGLAVPEPEALSRSA